VPVLYKNDRVSLYEFTGMSTDQALGLIGFRPGIFIYV